MAEITAPAPESVARRLNTSALLASLRRSDVLTVSELVAGTGLSRATVHSACTDLVRRGWVEELPSVREEGATVGRPSRRFRFAAGAGRVLGIDVGDTHLGILLADLRGTELIARRIRLPRRRTTAADRLERLAGLAAEVLADAGVGPADVLAAGIGLAAPVSRDGRVVGFGSESANPYWKLFQTEPQAVGAALGGVTALLANDADLAVLAERWRGRACGLDDVVVLLGGDRLGAGLMEGGRLLHGHSGGAGEMSFLDPFMDGRSAHGFAHLARTWARQLVDDGHVSTLGRPAGRTGGRAAAITTEDVFVAAAGGDEVAREVLARLAARVAQVVGAVSVLLDPEVVVIGGPIAESLQVIRGDVERRLAVLVPHPPGLRFSNLGDRIVTLGAVRLALDHVEQHALDIDLPDHG